MDLNQELFRLNKLATLPNDPESRLAVLLASATALAVLPKGDVGLWEDDDDEDRLLPLGVVGAGGLRVFDGAVSGRRGVAGLDLMLAARREG